MSRKKKSQTYIIHMEPVPETPDVTQQLLLNTYRFRAFEYVESLKTIYMQPPARREPGWQAKILQLNSMAPLANEGWGADEWVLSSYVLCKGSLSQEEILFLNFLFQHGAHKTPFVIASSVFISISYKYQNHHYLRWLLEDCDCLVFGDTHRGHPLLGVEAQPDSLWSACFLEKLPHCNANNDTALIVAVRFKLFKLAKWLIEEKGHDINAKNSDGETALFIAVRYKYEEFINYLLSQNADIYTRSANDQTVFHRAILDNNIDLLIRLNMLVKQHNRKLEEVCTTEGYNLAQWAIMNGAYFMLPYLLIDISPHLHDPVGRNLAIISASFSGSHDFTASLLRSHPDLNIHEVTQEGMNVLHHCIVETGGGIPTLNWLVNDLNVDLEARNSSGDTPLLLAAKLKKIALVKYLSGLREKTVDTRAIASNGRHVGHYLAEFDQHELINSLLKANKLDFAHCDNEGNTMFDVALTNPASHHASIRECMMYLEKASKKRDGSALSFKTLKKLPSLLNYLCKNNIGEFGPWLEDGQTPFHMACIYLSRDEIKVLVTECKLNTNSLNQKLQTPFCTVVKHRSFEDVVWFNQQFQPKTTKMDGLQSSLLHLACEQGNFELVRWCLEKPGSGLSIVKTRKDGCSALDIALIKENLEIVRYLMGRLTEIERCNYIDSLLQDDSLSLAYLTRHGLYTPPSSAVIVQQEECAEGEGLPVFLRAPDAMTFVDSTKENDKPLEQEKTSHTISVARSLKKERKQARREAARRLALSSEIEPGVVYSSVAAAEDLTMVCDAMNARATPLEEAVTPPPKLNSLSAMAPPWSGHPRCYLENSYLRFLLDEISILFKASPCDGYLYGSAHYKTNPGDFDILITNIKTPEDVKNAQNLIGSFIRQGAVVTVTNPVSGEWGYRKINRYVIPVEWKEFKLEFIISSQDCSEHAKLLDFTIGARYFNLKNQAMHSISGVNAFVDTYRKEIHTIIDPLESFSQDLSRVFRAVRLAAEGFVLPEATKEAIKIIFSRPSNPLFTEMDPNKLTQQLTLLFASPYKLENLIILNDLGGLVRLVECLSTRVDRAGRYYFEQIKPYYMNDFSATPVDSLMACTSEIPGAGAKVGKHRMGLFTQENKRITQPPESQSSQCFFSCKEKLEYENKAKLRIKMPFKK